MLARHARIGAVERQLALLAGRYHPVGRPRRRLSDLREEEERQRPRRVTTCLRGERHVQGKHWRGPWRKRRSGRGAGGAAGSACIESSGVKPSRLGSPTDAPRQTSCCASSMQPPKAAMCVAVLPLSFSAASSGRLPPAASASICNIRDAGSAETSAARPPPAPLPSGGGDARMADRCCSERTARSARR